MESSKPAKVTPGSVGVESSKPAKVTPGSQGTQSLCLPFREVILEKLERGLSAQRIYQDLIEEHDFEGSYQSVKRFVRSLGRLGSLPFRRLESLPGDEAQVDFGQGALVEQEGKNRRRPHLFRIVLSFSRKAYSEVVWRQDTESFIRCLENAFLHFGGVTKTLVTDNLKAAVKQPDWYDPEINPKLASCARHYGVAVLPTKPYTPRHKGKVEAGVKYSQENALKGRSFTSLQEHNAFLRDWERNVADLRIHGTTRRQVRKQFEEELKALLPLPCDRFPLFSESERKVHRDGHIAVEKSFYSVPPEYLGRQLWVRWNQRIVRIYDQNLVQIAVHAKLAPGRFSTKKSHIADEKISGVERGADYLLSRMRHLGPESYRWGAGVLRERGVQAIRTLQGFLALSRKYPCAELERVTKLALERQVFRLRPLRQMLKRADDDAGPTFIESHAVNRDISEYGKLIHVNFGSQQSERTLHE